MLFFVIFIVFLVSSVAGQPLAIEARAYSNTANEFTRGGCRANIFIFARGTTEKGNLGDLVGPQLSASLKQALGEQQLATEGVEYQAKVSSDVLPAGCSKSEAEGMARLIAQATTQCPASNIVVGGYSQGAALTHTAFGMLYPAVTSRIAAVVLFGDTQRKQQHGQLANYPPDKFNIICNDGDAVCDGTLIVRPPHLQYGARIQEASNFLVSKLVGPGTLRFRSTE